MRSKTVLLVEEHRVEGSTRIEIEIQRLIKGLPRCKAEMLSCVVLLDLYSAFYHLPVGAGTGLGLTGYWLWGLQ